MSDEKLDITRKLLEMLLNKFSDYLMKYWGIHEPTVVLRECITKKEWFKGVVLATAFLEAIGKMALSDDLRGKIGYERIKNLSLEQITIDCLETLIDKWAENEENISRLWEKTIGKKLKKSTLDL